MSKVARPAVTRHFLPSTTWHHQQTRTFINSIFDAALGRPPLRTLTHTKTIPYSAQSIFKAISDVSGYPSFLPLAISSIVTSRDGHGYPTSARLKVGYSMLNLEECWDSVIKCDEGRGIIEASNSEADGRGPFEVLKTRWLIESQKESKSNTTVKLDLAVKFRSNLYDTAFAQVQSRVAEDMITAFEKRVKELERPK